MISLTRSGAHVVKGVEWTANKEALDLRHGVVLKGFVDPALLTQVRRLLKTPRFTEAVHVDSSDVPIRAESTLDYRDPLAKFFYFLTNRKGLFAAVGELAQCDTNIHAFDGRGYRTLAGVHFDSWHNDLVRGSIGLSVNLQPEPVVGGEFQIQHLWSGVIHTFPVPEFGDALLFKIGRLLYHRVLPVKGVVPRFCYAGWFVTS